MTNRFGSVAAIAAVTVVFALAGPARAAEVVTIKAGDADAAKKIQAAKAGSVVFFEPGTYKVGNVKVPAGVLVVGSGAAETIFDATGFENGLTFSGETPKNSDGLRLGGMTDVTVRNATGAGVIVDKAGPLTLSRIAVLDCPAGMPVAKATACSLDNVIVANAQSGISLVDCTDISLVNATIADIAGTAINVSGCSKVTIFNNLVAGAAFGIVLGDNKDVAINHNIYNANYVGRMPGHTYRKRVEAWYHLSGYDRHSQTIGVEFADADKHDYRVTSPLSWSPVRATTAYAGTAEFNKVKAPDTDITGQKRGPSVDIGAHQSAFAAPRKADGTFEVKNGDGITSAGLFTKDGVCVRYLFQNTPLAKGTYEFWLPSRDWQGREIKPGDYEVRLIESNMKLQYIAAGGNGDPETSKKLPATTKKRYSLDPFAAAFTDDGRIIFSQSGFESGEHVRMFSPDMGDIPWSMTGGGHAVAVAIDHKNKHAYVLRQGEGQPLRACSLIRIHVEDGTPAPFKNGSFEKGFEEIKGAGGMTLLGDKLYITEPAANKVHTLTIKDNDVTVTGGFSGGELVSPTQIAADDKSGLLWIVCDNKQLLALTPAEGNLAWPSQKVASVDQPTSVAANNGRVAVYSAKDNKVTIYNAVKAGLQTVRTVGTGGESYGKIEGEKFWSPGSLALGKDSQLLVIDKPRTMVFDKDGKLVRQMNGMWGQGIGYGMFAGDDRMHFFNINGEYSIIFDAKNQTWEPGTRWKYTMTQATPNFCYAAGGKTFAIYHAREKDQPTYLYVTRLESETGTARAVSRYGFDTEGLFRQLANAEGIVADDAAKEYIKDAEGKAITANFINEPGFTSTDFNVNGHLFIPLRKHIQYIPMTGLDANGVPAYDFTKMKLITGLVEGQTTFTSPYDFQTTEDVSIAQDVWMFEDGSFTAPVSVKSGPGPDLASEHTNATNAAGFDANGNMRWFSPLNPFGLKIGFQGHLAMGDIAFFGRGAICEWETMDRDGLGTGAIGTPADMGWGGMWLDNPRQMQPFVGNDGKHYLIVGDYCAQAYHWMTLIGQDKLVRQRVAVKVDDALAAELAKAPAKPMPHFPVPQPPKFTIKKIDKELPMDGDLAKWRTLGIKPIVVGPDQTLKNDPRDTSAVIRMAWNGEKIFVQVIKFDDVITFHQRNIHAHYLQDGIEMCINIFYNGWKYNVTRMEGKDVVFRDRFFEQNSGFVDEKMVPRKITVFDNAKDVEERKMFEASRGVDMSNCKVMLVEFTLTKAAIEGMSGGWQAELESGKSFIVGFSINDGDIPGADLMNLITWPVMYGTFSRAEAFATATLE